MSRFHFDDSSAGGNVDSSARTITDLLFQPWGVQVEVGGSQKSLDVGLNVSFSAPSGVWRREANDQGLWGVLVATKSGLAPGK